MDQRTLDQLTLATLIAGLAPRSEYNGRLENIIEDAVKLNAQIKCHLDEKEDEGFTEDRPLEVSNSHITELETEVNQLKAEAGSLTRERDSAYSSVNKLRKKNTELEEKVAFYTDKEES